MTPFTAVLATVREGPHVERLDMSNVFAFEWCICIFESGFSLVSLHDTKRGALRAMIAAANLRWQEGRNWQLMYGNGGKERFDPLKFEAWRVRAIELHNVELTGSPRAASPAEPKA